MANQITGKILYIYPPQQITTKDGSKTIVKRGVVLDCTRYDPYTGERGFENTPLMEFFGDKCAELDNFQIGQVVTVLFDLQGSKYAGDDGRSKIFTSVRPYKIELKQVQAGQSNQPVQASKPMQQPIQQPVQQPIQQPTQRSYQQQYQQQTMSTDMNPSVDDDGFIF